MALLEQWQKVAYNEKTDRGELQRFWQRYFLLEKGVYEQLLTNPDEAVEGTVKEYDVNIQKIDLETKEVNKGIVLEITDEKLLGLTGGIVQGMSGSPIIQNGKLVGAVTHVLVNDPTRGYGIFIENMLNAAG